MGNGKGVIPNEVNQLRGADIPSVNDELDDVVEQSEENVTVYEDIEATLCKRTKGEHSLKLDEMLAIARTFKYAAKSLKPIQG